MRLGFELCPASEEKGEVGWVAEHNGENPYGVDKLKKAVDDPSSSKIDVILSIPSPYARWHIAEIGLEEALTRSFGEAKGGVEEKILAPVYQRAISHLLDLFELFYRFNGTQLSDLGFEIKKHKFAYKSDLNASKSIIDYVDTLELYRQNYKKNFDSFYEILRYGQPIGVTSPFSVFATPHDISQIAEIDIPDYRKLFAQDRWSKTTGKAQWAGIEERDKEFQTFLYALLRRGNYSQKFEPLYFYVKKRMNQERMHVVEADSNYFENNYPEFVIKGQAGIPLATDAQFRSDIELLPLGYDTFVFENFLNTQSAHDYSCIKPEDYNTEISSRKNIFSGDPSRSLMWVTIDDILEPAVFMTQMPIDEEKYLASPVEGSNIILPVKKTFFQLFNLFDNTGKLASQLNINEWFEVKKVTEGDEAYGEVNTNIYVTVKLPKKYGGRVSVTKVYQESIGQVKKINLDFGIYPFLQVNREVHHAGPDNFYRMFLYLDGGDCLTDCAQDIKLYSRNSQNLLNPSHLVNDPGRFHIQSHSTINEINQESVRDNLYYVSLESIYYKNNQPEPYRDIRFNFIEVNLNGCNFMIVPRFNVSTLGTSTEITIAYDLGTSNTYVAYGRPGQAPTSFESAIGEELVGKFTKRELVLDQSLGGPSNYDLHQLAEFLPTKFSPKDAHFPIQTVQLYVPTVTNDTELNAGTFNTITGAPFVSMFTMNVPFYFDRTGIRSIGNIDLDSPITGFKWFSSEGDKCKELNAFRMFIDQLVFMLRNKLIMEQNLDTSYVKLVWTYPLALSKSKKALFSKEWKCAYEKYFGNHSNNKVISFTESETPIESNKEIAKQREIKVGIDIGGGTSDVIIYQPRIGNGGNNENDIALATSFSFAGNTMFGKLVGNYAEMTNKENLWFKTMQSFIPRNSSNEGMHSKVVDLSPDNRNITEIMDYIFTHAMKENEEGVRVVLDKPYLKFISLMHISAIIWEVAKICKMKLGDSKMPKNVVLSGNGSKLVLLSEMEGEQKNRDITALVNGIFKIVYKASKVEIAVTKLEQPKRATAYGAIELANSNISLSKASNCYYIPFNGQIYLQDDDNISDDIFNSTDASSSGSTSLQPSTSGGSELDAFFGIEEPESTSTNDEQIIAEPVSMTGKPTVDSIESNWKQIAKEVGEFMDFYYKLAGSKLGGSIPYSTCLKIKERIFGSSTSYETEEMHGIIERAKEILEFNTKQAEGQDSVDIRESIFLQVIAVQLASTIKEFGKMFK